MARKLTASDRKSLIRLASQMEKGSPERRAILKVAVSWDRGPTIGPRLRKKYENHKALSAELGQKLERELRPFRTLKEVTSLSDVDGLYGEAVSEGWWKGSRSGKVLLIVRTNGWDEIEEIKSAVADFAQKNGLLVDPRSSLTLTIR